MSVFTVGKGKGHMGRYTSVALGHGNLSYLPLFPYHSSSPGFSFHIDKTNNSFIKNIFKKLVHVLHFSKYLFFNDLQ
jgi:hypothetical protein